MSVQVGYTKQVLFGILFLLIIIVFSAAVSVNVNPHGTVLRGRQSGLMLETVAPEASYEEISGRI